VDLVVCDVSFISATQILGVMSNIIDDNKYIILLIKPQFEMEGKIKFKNGIVNDEKLRKSACEKVVNKAIENNLTPLKITKAPLSDGKNVEYLLLLKKGGINSQLNLLDFKF